MVGEAVVVAGEDVVHFFGGVCVGAVGDGEEVACGVPCEAVGVADAAGEDFELGGGGGVEAPDGGGEVGFASG